MDENNLLEQILIENKKRTLFAKIAAFAATGIFVLIIVVTFMIVPKVFRLFNEADALVDSTQKLVTTAETSLEEISVMTSSLTETSLGLDTFITDNAQTIEDAITDLEAIDVETLNQAITDLHDAVAPFANLMNRFK